MLSEILNGRNRYQIFSTNDRRFREYGHLVEGIDFADALRCLESSTGIPEGAVYVPSLPELEALPLRRAVSDGVFGVMDLQLGYCNGMTAGLDALEYHKSPEVTVADSDIVLFLARASWLEDGHLHDDAIEAFFLPAGVPVELHAGTLHFAPCRTSGRGYRSLVVLPAGTNLPLDPDHPLGDSGESRLLFARNKWLIARPDCARLMVRGAFPGLDGERLELFL